MSKTYTLASGEVIKNSCGNCGCEDLEEYDGLLGYEALICKVCKAVHDWQGLWVNDKLVAPVAK